MRRRVSLVIAALATAAAVGFGLNVDPATAWLRGILDPAVAGSASASPGPFATDGTGVATPPSANDPSPGASAAPTADPTPTQPPTVASAPGPTANIRIVERLEERLEVLRRVLGIPGVQVSIVFPDGTAWTGVSGYADIAGSVPVSPRTPFAIASISKSFTAAVILQLVAERRLELDESVAARLPALKLDSRITVRQLLDHTSGLNDYLVRTVVDRALRAEQATAWTPERAMSYVGKPYFNPGRGWHYSNTNYVVLGLLAEAVTGEPLAASLRTRIFEPLGLSTATYQGIDDPPAAVARAYRFTVRQPAGAAIEWDDGTGIVPFTAVVTATAGAGSIAASSADVARFAREMWGGDIIPKWLLNEAIADAARVDRIRGALAYGLGLQAYPVDGRVAFGHSGRFSGARAVVRYVPDADVAIAVLTNQSRVDPARILRDLLAIAAPVSRSGAQAFLD